MCLTQIPAAIPAKLSKMYPKCNVCTHLGNFLDGRDIDLPRMFQKLSWMNSVVCRLDHASITCPWPPFISNNIFHQNLEVFESLIFFGKLAQLSHFLEDALNIM